MSKTRNFPATLTLRHSERENEFTALPQFSIANKQSRVFTSKVFHFSTNTLTHTHTHTGYNFKALSCTPTYLTPPPP